MTITKEITRLEQSNVKLTLTIPKDDLVSEYNELITDYAKKIQIPGFRKGKVPRDIIIRKLGDALKQEILGKIFEKSIEETFKEESLSREDRPLPYSKPELRDELKLDLEQDLQFSLFYDVIPQVIVDKWEGFETEIPDVAVTDEDLNRELEYIRERNAVVLDKDETEEAAINDVVTVNYCELDENSEVLPGTEREDFAFTLGSGYNLYNFDREIEGMKKGEIRSFDKTYPADFNDPNLAGKTKKLKVALTALKLKKLPELDDDFAQDVDEQFKTLDDLKNSIQDRLSENLKRSLREIKNSKIIEKIMEASPVTIPESMVQLELDSRLRNMTQRLNTDMEGLLKMMDKSGGNVPTLFDEWRPNAVRALHSRLIVETLMENLKLEVSDEEVEREIDRLAAQEESAERIRKIYQEEQMREYLKENIKEQKLFDILLEKNIVKTGNKLNYIDLMANNG